MKYIIRSVSVIIIGLILSMMISCKGIKPNAVKTAPGQVKKETGSQSAKPFAPGQQKKKTKN